MILGKRAFTIDKQVLDPLGVATPDGMMKVEFLVSGGIPLLGEFVYFPEFIFYGNVALC